MENNQGHTVRWEDLSRWRHDLLVLHTIMGWRWLIGAHPDVPGTPQRWLLPPHLRIRDVGPDEWVRYADDEDADAPDWAHTYTILEVPSYTTEMEAAWEVVEHLELQPGIRFQRLSRSAPSSRSVPLSRSAPPFGSVPSITEWQAAFWVARGSREAAPVTVVEWASSAPEAVCKAALHALGVDLQSIVE